MEQQGAQVERISILVEYTNVVKAPDLYILDLIKTKLRDKFKDTVDFATLDTLTNEALLLAWVNRPIENVLEWITLGGKYYNFDTTYNSLIEKLDFLYKEAAVLRFDSVIRNYATNPAIIQIYLWSPIYDQRIFDDIKHNYAQLQKIQYVAGKQLKSVMNKVGPIHIAYLSRADYVPELLPDFPNTIFAVGGYGYNYSYDFEDDFGLLKYKLNEFPNVSTFPIIDVETSSLFNG